MQYRCGTSSSVLGSPAKAPRAEVDSVRLVAHLHFPKKQAPGASIRLIGILPNGEQALICFADDVAQALRRAQNGEARFVAFHVQEWGNEGLHGSWRTVALRLPKRSRRPRRRRADIDAA